MNSLSGSTDDMRTRPPTRLWLGVLMALHSAVVCWSLITVAERQSNYISYDSERLWIAIAVAIAFSIVLLLFVATRFSFGWLIAFYFYTMVLGFLWIETFSKFDYDHRLAGISAALSLLLFLIPMLFIKAPLRQAFALSEARFQLLLNLILALSIVIIAAASTYNFRPVGLGRIYDFRDELQFPTVLRYLTGMVSSTALPFAFACYWLLGQRWRAALVLVLLLLFYPITLTKYAFFTPIWLVALVILARLADMRIAVVLSLFLPMALGRAMVFISMWPIEDYARFYFNLVNIRMIATPSSALDIYNHFFASHPLTWFCQISALKQLVHCPYQEPLAVVMQNTYGFGNLNASLFATEGVASVGLWLAPLTALASGLVLAFGNRASAGLSPCFILISAGTLPHILLNVPLSVAMLTHGIAILFLLWYVTPRTLFEPKP